MDSPLVLASASPRRRELLDRLDVSFRVLPAEVDETPRADETPEALAARLAGAKARAVAARTGESVVLGADTVVGLDERALGKPRDAADAAAMLRLLAGREHRVVTALVLLDRAGAKRAVTTTRLWFSPLTDAQIAAYVASGEACDAAGAYAIQGAGAAFLARLVGSYGNVVGLPLAATAGLLRAGGLLT